LQHWGSARWSWLALAVAALASVSCTPGQYPVEVFKELHYQPSHRYLEPDRLAPPADSVPVTGRSSFVPFAQASSLQAPASARRTTESQQQARALFRVNCSMCHGQDGKGKSYVADRFADSNAPAVPVDLSGSRASGRSDGELYWIVSNGLGNMPRFSELLTDDQRWLLISAIREVQGR